jgi:hypothetical protein
VTAFPRIALCAALLGASARADEALVRAQQHYQAGLDHYKAQKYDDALREFQTAFSLKPIPRVLVNIGQTYLAMGNKAAALEQLQQFLHLARLSDPERAGVEKQVQELSATTAPPPDTEEELAQPEPLPEDRSERTTRKAAEGPALLVHTPPEETAVGKAIPLVVELPAGIQAAVVSAHYRNAGDAAFTRLLLEPQGNAYVTAIPGRKVRGSAVQYYVQAFDEGGRVVAVSGTETSPHLVVVAGGAAYSPRTPRPAPVSRYRKWFWASVVAAGALLTTGTVTALLAKNRENALEQRANASIALGEGHRALWSQDDANLETEGQTFEAVSVLTLIMGGVAAGGAGTFWFLERHEPRRAAVDPLLLQHMSFQR